MRRLLAVAALVGAVALVLRRWFPVKVAGDSMEPTLRAGDHLAVRPLAWLEPRSHQIVVVHAAGLEMVKRVTAWRTPGSYEVTGDNVDRSLDSRRFGAVVADDIAGVARAVYWPLRRARLL
jgi:signal peptidase I